MISITILAKNAEATLRKTLDSTRAFDEVLILDNGSTDNTLAIAQEYPNVTIHHSPFIGFGPLHNLANNLANHDWIFALDSDEVIPEPLQRKLLQGNFDPDCAYMVNRKNFFNGKWIRGCGWYPDQKVRLFNRKKTQFTSDAVHEQVITDNLTVVHLKLAIHHYSYRSVADFIPKMDHYSTLYAQDKQGKKKSSFAKALVASWIAFIKSYFIKGGIFDGKEGFIISLYNSQTSFYKYLKLAEKNKAL